MHKMERTNHGRGLSLWIVAQVGKSEGAMKSRELKH